MVKAIVSVFGLTLFLATCIIMWQDLNKQERWSLVKTLGFAFMCSAIAGFIVGIFVALF